MMLRSIPVCVKCFSETSFVGNEDQTCKRGCLGPWYWSTCLPSTTFITVLILPSVSSVVDKNDEKTKKRTWLTNIKILFEANSNIICRLNSGKTTLPERFEEV